MDQDLYNQLIGLPDDELEERLQQMIRVSKSLPHFKNDQKFRQMVMEMEKSAEAFSDAVAREISVKLMCEIEMDAKFAEADIAYDNMRQALIKGIIDNPDNDGLRKMANDIMQIEKDHGHHDPEKWKGLAGL